MSASIIKRWNITFFFHLISNWSQESRMANGVWLTNQIFLCRNAPSYSMKSTLIQETNLSGKRIEKSSSHCSLTEALISRNIQTKQKCSSISSKTEENLDKLQRISNDVKYLTKQLQRSVASHKNNNAAATLKFGTKLKKRSFGNKKKIVFFSIDERLLGEICYQLERRILILIFPQVKHLYGYSLRYLSDLIQRNADRFQCEKRFIRVENYLRKCDFDFLRHSSFTFEMINKHGIYSDYDWLTSHSEFISNIEQLKSFCYSMLTRTIHRDFSIVIDSLRLIANFDGQPMFYWWLKIDGKSENTNQI